MEVRFCRRRLWLDAAIVIYSVQGQVEVTKESIRGRLLCEISKETFDRKEDNSLVVVVKIL